MIIKDNHARDTSFSRSVIAGAICGLIAALLNAVYDLFYRTTTGFESDKLISPVPIFFAVPALLIIAGVIFFEMVEFIKMGKLLFTVLFLSLTLLAIIIDVFQNGNRNSLSGMRGLLLGIEILTGLVIALLLPFLATHPKIFMENEEFSESVDD
jgi:drug/metabolite transporter (DMT)-like permease